MLSSQFACELASCEPLRDHVLQTGLCTQVKFPYRYHHSHFHSTSFSFVSFLEQTVICEFVAHRHHMLSYPLAQEGTKLVTGVRHWFSLCNSPLFRWVSQCLDTQMSILRTCTISKSLRYLLQVHDAFGKFTFISSNLSSDNDREDSEGTLFLALYFDVEASTRSVETCLCLPLYSHEVLGSDESGGIVAG